MLTSGFVSGTSENPKQGAENGFLLLVRFLNKTRSKQNCLF